MTNSISTDGKRPGPRQAVILIHGIGEQRPMGTLRAFVDALLDPAPSTASPTPSRNRMNFVASSCGAYRANRGGRGERRLARDGLLRDTAGRPDAGTNVGHLVDWLRVLMAAARKPRRNRELFARLSLADQVAGGDHVARCPPALVAAVWFAAEQPAAALSATAAVVLLMLLKRIVAPILATALLDVVGDAARYLDVSPKNVARRYDVIRGGVDMLGTSHKASDEAAPNGPVDVHVRPHRPGRPQPWQRDRVR